MTNKEIFPHPLSVHSYLLRIRGGASLYLESGVLDLIERAPLNADSYLPAQLYFDDGLSSYALTDSAFMGEISIDSTLAITYDPPLEEGRSETGVGYKKSKMTATVTGTYTGSSGDVTIEQFHSTTPDFRQGVQNRKDAQTYFPPSVFGGKMRMYVQSIYGSKRTDYSYTEPLVGTKLNGDLTIDGEEYNPYRGTTTHWIYTTDEYEYFLMSLSSGTVTATQMELSKQGDRLRRWLLDESLGAEETRRVEGYLLSTTSLGDTVTVASASDTAPANSHGSAPIYGWHWNMAGTEGQIVAMSQVDEHSAEATHLKMTASLNTGERENDEDYWKESTAWSFTTTAEEGPTEFTLGQGDLFWRADLVFAGMEKFVTSEPGDPMIDADVPVYVVYNYADDDFDLIRHKRVSGLSDIGGNVGSGSQVSTLDSEEGCNYYTTASSASERGFYIGGETNATAVAYDASNVSGNAVEVRLGEFLGCTGGEAFYLCFGGGASYTGAFSFTSHCTIPVGDLDSVYLGGKEHFDGDINWLNGTLGGTVHNDVGWDSCSGGSPVGSHAIDWIDPFFPSDQQNASFHTRLKNDGLNGGTAEDGSITDAEWDTIWVLYWHNGEYLELHEHQRSSDDGGTENGIYLPSCLQLRPWSETAEEGGGYPVEPLDQGGWDTHFSQGPNTPEFNANGASSRTNMTGDYFAEDMANDNWITNSYSDLEDTTYISFVGHD